jgi:fatty-acyl-CoA synthase
VALFMSAKEIEDARAAPLGTNRYVLLGTPEFLTKDELLKFYEGKVAKWWLPDDVVFVNELPHTATGKLSKITLRQQLSDYRLPGT